MADKSYPPPCRNYLQPLYLSVTLYACAQRVDTYMYVPYQCIHSYKYKNDEVDRNLSCKCTALCYTLEYIYIVQIAKRRTSPVFAFNMQIPHKVKCLVEFAC